MLISCYFRLIIVIISKPLKGDPNRCIPGVTAHKHQVVGFSAIRAFSLSRHMLQSSIKTSQRKLGHAKFPNRVAGIAQTLAQTPHALKQFAHHNESKAALAKCVMLYRMLCTCVYKPYEIPQLPLFPAAQSLLLDAKAQTLSYHHANYAAWPFAQTSACQA